MGREWGERILSATSFCSDARSTALSWASLRNRCQRQLMQETECIHKYTVRCEGCAFLCIQPFFRGQYSNHIYKCVMHHVAALLYIDKRQKESAAWKQRVGLHSYKSHQKTTWYKCEEMKKFVNIGCRWSLCFNKQTCLLQGCKCVFQMIAGMRGGVKEHLCSRFANTSYQEILATRIPSDKKNGSIPWT